MSFFNDLQYSFLAGAASSGFDIGTFLDNSGKTLGKWFGLAAIILGLVAIIYAIYQIATGLMSHGKKQVNWFVTIALLLFGGMLTVGGGGFEFVKGIAGGGQKTITDLGTGGTIVLSQLKMFLP